MKKYELVNCGCDVASYCLVYKNDIKNCFYIENVERSDGVCSAYIFNTRNDLDEFIKDNNLTLEEVCWLREGWGLSTYDCPTINDYIVNFENDYVVIYKCEKGLIILNTK